MMENMKSWQLPCVHSPTESVDSGVGLSPPRTLAYGSYEDPCSQIFSDGACPESPIAGGTARVGEPHHALSTSTAYDPLTEEDLDRLSDTFSLSPQPVNSSPDLTEIGQLEFPQRQPGLEELLSESQEPSINTLNRKRRRQARHLGLCEANPGVDPCLVPKSGTAKPRQSRKKRRTGSGESMAGGQGAAMNPKFHAGARVKETAREKLQRIRRERNAAGVQECRPRVSQAITRQGQGPSYSHSGAHFGAMYQPSPDTLPQTSRPYIPHSVDQILCPGAAQFHSSTPNLTDYPRRDDLDQIIEEAAQRNNAGPLQLYVEQLVSNSARSEETIFHNILNRLNQKIDIYPPASVKRVVEHLCQILPKGINAKNLQGETPLYCAALYRSAGAVFALVEAGANPAIQENSAGQTALHAAVSSKKANVVEAVLRSLQRSPHWGHVLNIASCDGNTALHKATALRDVDLEVQKKIVQDLLSAGADTSIKNNMSEMAHSFLPDGLKELKEYMKRLNGRKRASAQHTLSAPGQIESPPYYRPHTVQTPYTQFTTEMIQPGFPYAGNPVAQRQRFQYETIPQTAQSFPPTYMSFPRSDALPTFTDPRVTNVVPNPQLSTEYQCDLEEILHSFK